MNKYINFFSEYTFFQLYQKFNHNCLLYNISIILLCIWIIFLFLFFLYKKINFFNIGRYNRSFYIKKVIYLSKNNYIYIVKLHDRFFVLGVTLNKISLLYIFPSLKNFDI